MTTSNTPKSAEDAAREAHARFAKGEQLHKVLVDLVVRERALEREACAALMKEKRTAALQSGIDLMEHQPRNINMALRSGAMADAYAYAEMAIRSRTDTAEKEKW